MTPDVPSYWAKQATERGKIIDVAKSFDRGFLGGKAVRSCKCRGYVPYKILIKNLLGENIANLV